MLPKEKLINMLRLMCTIRQFEEKIKELYRQNLVTGAIHSYAGEEAVAVGVCSAIEKTDYIVSTHRGHGHAIAVGAGLSSKYRDSGQVAISFFSDGASNNGTFHESKGTVKRGLSQFF